MSNETKALSISFRSDDGCIEHNLIAHGAGNVIYRLAKAQNSEIRPAGLALADGKLWDEAEKLFDGGNN